MMKSIMYYFLLISSHFDLACGVGRLHCHAMNTSYLWSHHLIRTIGGQVCRLQLVPPPTISPAQPRSYDISLCRPLPPPVAPHLSSATTGNCTAIVFGRGIYHTHLYNFCFRHCKSGTRQLVA